MSNLKKITIIKPIGIFLCLLFCACTLAGCKANSPDYSYLIDPNYISTSAETFVDEQGFTSIKLSENRDIKILQLTDIHLGNGGLCVKKDKAAVKAVCTLIENTNPDLIILTGDVIYPTLPITGSNDNLAQLEVVASVIEKYKTPWTMCFGNHDAEWLAQYPKSDLCDYLESSELNYCLFERGPSNIEGMGNHAINVYNADNSLNSSLILFDNGEYVGDSQLTGYIEISPAQTEWYEGIVNTMNTAIGTTIQSMIFYHVPGVEYQNAWSAYKNKDSDVVYYFGNANEPNQRISCPQNIGTLYDKIMELGSTKAIFCGHDHLNDFSIEYKGVRFTYSKSIDYIAYVIQGIAYKTEQRGGALIILKNSGSEMLEAFKIESIKLTDID